MTRYIYLDNNATTRPLPSVIGAVLATMTDSYGNPSSAHSHGGQARHQSEEARQAVARPIGAPGGALISTSGATEANNLAILSCLSHGQSNARIVTTTVEHSSVLSLCDRHARAGGSV